MGRGRQADTVNITDGSHRERLRREMRNCCSSERREVANPPMIAFILGGLVSVALAQNSCGDNGGKPMMQNDLTNCDW